MSDLALTVVTQTVVEALQCVHGRRLLKMVCGHYVVL